MAGDFIMVQFATPRKPEVLRLASLLRVAPQHAFGLCVIAWMWFDEQTEDGRAFVALLSREESDEDALHVALDAIVGHSGFSSALTKVGWLTVENGALVIPNFDRTMGQSAKKRVKNTVRQQQVRQKQCRASVAQSSRTSRDKSATKEEKRREENTNTPLPPKGGDGDRKRSPQIYGESIPIPASLDVPEFVSAWKLWLDEKFNRKHKLTEQGWIQQLAALSELGPDGAVAAIKAAIANGWRGVVFADTAARQRAGKPQQPSDLFGGLKSFAERAANDQA